MAENLTARELAASQGRRTYVSGEPCPQGHNGERYTLNSNCVACQKAWNAASRAKFRALVNGAAKRDMGA